LVAGLVPQDFQAERGEQAGLEGGRQAGQDVSQCREFIEQGGVGGGRGGLGQGGELGFEVFAFVVEVGEAARMRARMAAAAVSAGSAGCCSSSRIWEFCAVSIRLIRALRAAAWVSRWAAASASVAGSWAARSPARPGPKMRVAKNWPTTWSSRASGAWTVRGWSGWLAACLGVAGLWGHR